MSKFLLTTILSFIVSASLCYPQFDILKKVKEKVEQKAEEKTDEAIDKTVDDATDGENEEEQETSESEDNNEEADVNEGENSAPEKTKSEFKSFSKYDFVPGEQILFFEDFSQDAVGDFPALWNTNSSGEVVTLSNFEGHWFQFGNDGVFLPDMTEKTFGENFTVEYDLIYAPTAKGNLPEYGIEFITEKREDEQIDAYVPGKGGCAIWMGAYRSSVRSWYDQQYGDIDNSKEISIIRENSGQKVRVSFAFQKQRVRFWINEQKIFDLPRLLEKGLNMSRIRITTTETDDLKPYLYISNIRIAVGAPDIRSKLITEGKLVTRGILFDTNSDKIKPESYGTLKEIANVLKENESVKVIIVGHTDSDGSDESNLDLSKRRAASVKNMLNSEFGIEDSRMETDGKGESEPAGSNVTPDGKANNRRVEFIKL